MYYTAKIIDPAEGIGQICVAASKFSIERFLYALQYKNWDEKDLERLGSEVADYRQKLEKEYIRLVEFSQFFNKEFVTVNNKCFSSAMTMLRKLRSGISETKRLFMKFCPRAHRERMYSEILNSPVSAYEYSYLSAKTYQLPLFTLEGYPECVSGLYNEMQRFFLLLMRCIRLCQDVLKDEARIKDDNKYCKYLFEEFRKKVLTEIMDIVMMIPRNSEFLTEEKNSAIASRSRYDNDDAWAPVGFHSYTRTEVKQLIIKQVLDDNLGSDITLVERNIFGDEEDKVHRWRHIIQHFDELIPDTYHRKNLPAKYVQMFFLFVGIPYKLESVAVDYFNETYLSAPAHKFTTVSYQAINGYKKQLLEDRNGVFKTFTDELKERFYPPLTAQKAENF